MNIYDLLDCSHFLQISNRNNLFFKLENVSMDYVQLYLFLSSFYICESIFVAIMREQQM